MTLLLLTISRPNGYGADQPQSTIAEGEQFTAYLDPDGDLQLSTSEVPVAPCPGWTAQGDPDYYWDFGPLNGLDNGDGTATIHTDVEGSYNVTVYCGQQFDDGNGNSSYEQTEPSS